MTATGIEAPPSSTGWRVWGHDHAVHELRSAIDKGVRHAYILSGYHHVGKTALAQEFARALMCGSSPSPGQPCGVCSACRRVGRGAHPDVTLYDLARQQETSDKASTSKNLSLNIQTVRDITSSISLRPMEARHRVVIVDDVETMQETAQEAFLKTLEEPPPYAVILLLTTDAELLLETIRSRCMTLHLQTVRPSTILDLLLATGLDEKDATAIAAASIGRPGWAVQAASDPNILRERLELESLVKGWITGDQYRRMVEATRLGDVFSKDRAAVYARLSLAQTMWREIVLHALGVVDVDRPDKNIFEGQQPTAGEGVTALRSVERCLNDLDANVRPKLALQSMVLQWPTIAAR
ncbi:MAG TPA: DNA polymerase III subunit [Thermomicrobiales bacterium]|nr:DNA polymerase III subunit [Thermomicrobiales bacterium]